MERELSKFGGGVSETIVNPVVLVFVVIAGILICVLPRRKAITPFFVASILIPMDQVVVIGPFHFMMLRVLILFGLIRMVRKSCSSGSKVFGTGMNKIDLVVMLLAIFTAIGSVLLWQDSGMVTHQLGEIYTVFGVYFLLRFLIRDREDILLAVRILARIVAVIAVIMAYEQAHGFNPYAALGGAKASFFSSTMERGERYRATGCFSHPILAGTCGAVLLPLFFALWCTDKKHRGTAILGAIAATVMVIASNSSTPVMAYLAGLLAICFWPLRNWMRPIRWGVVLLLVSLHLVMKAPVWHLVARVDVVGGSSADHRYQLINQCIRHFGDWWLVGVKDNGQWGWDMWDTANQYVALGESSGLFPLILFLALIVYGFKYLGKKRRSATTRREALFLWSLGAALFAHAVGFFGITYFDQTIVVWYALLAMISAAVAPSVRPNDGKKRLRSSVSSGVPSLDVTPPGVYVAGP